MTASSHLPQLYHAAREDQKSPYEVDLSVLVQLLNWLIEVLKFVREDGHFGGSTFPSQEPTAGERTGRRLPGSSRPPNAFTMFDTDRVGESGLEIDISPADMNYPFGLRRPPASP